jgi:hypothetical protein
MRISSARFFFDGTRLILQVPSNGKLGLIPKALHAALQAALH